MLIAPQLKELTNIVKLTIKEISVDNGSSKTLLENLEELETDCDPIFIETPNLLKLQCKGIVLPSKFLETCGNLTHLTCETTKNFKVKGIRQNLIFLDIKVPDETSINLLLESQKDSLKELKLYSNKHAEVEFAINNMKLEKLNVTMTTGLNALSKNFSIKELNLTSFGPSSLMFSIGSDQVVQSIPKIFESCSSIEKLTMLHKSFDTRIKVMLPAAFLRNLKHLVISGDFYNVETGNCLFDSIESIQFEYFKNAYMTACLKLLEKCSNLKKLKFKFEPDFMGDNSIETIVSNKLQKILDHAPNLKELDCNKAFELSDDVIMILQKSQIRSLMFTVYKNLYDKQQSLAVRLSKQSQIRCTVFGKQKINWSNLTEVFNMIKLDLGLSSNNDEDDDNFHLGSSSALNFPGHSRNFPY